MDLQMLITFGIGIVSLSCFFGTMFGVQRLVAKGVDTGKALQTAENFVDTVMIANDTLKPFIPSPVESIIDTVIKATQAGVHSAEQLYQSNQIPPDLRKDKALEYAINLIKLTGQEVTIELEQSISETTEGAVFIMKQQEQKLKQQEQKVDGGVQEQEPRSPIIKTEIELLPMIVN